MRGAHAAVEPTVLCPGCRHGARLHNVVGCVRGDCECSVTRAELDGEPAQAPAALAAPAGRALDLIDPQCRCGDRRSKHVKTGSATPCQRCGCKDFTTTSPETADAAPVAPPAEPAPAPPAAAPAPAATPAPPQHVDAAPRRPRPAVAAPKPPRRQDPRPANEALVASAVIGEDDADQVVTADRSPSAAVTTDLDRFRACPIGCGWTQERTEFDDEVGLRASRAQHLAGHSTSEIIGALDARAANGGVVVSPATATPVEQLLNAAVWLSARWYCPTCHSWPPDSCTCKACHALICKACRGPLRPVYLLTVPREVTP